MSLLRSRRFLAGGVALAAGTAAVAAPAVAPPLSAGPLDDAEVDPMVNGDSGTYESCTAMFGLTDKEDATYVTFTVGGTASPLPAIGDGLTPVLTVAVGDEVQECEPEVGFSDSESWFDYLDESGASGFPIAAVGFPYPGSPGYLVPTIVTVAAVSPASSAPLTLRVESTDPSLTVTSAPTVLEFTEPTTPELIEEIATELGGSSTPLGIEFLQLTDSGCPPGPSDELAAALIALTGIPTQLYVDQGIDTPCEQSEAAAEFRAAQLLVEALGIDVLVTVDAPAPEPTPGPTPEPVAPSFTG